jgi:hypothetical protein
VNTRWFNNTQPQTLQVAVMLLYLNAAFLVLAALTGNTSPYVLAIMLGEAAGAFGIANEKKWGYAVGVVAACLPLVLLILRRGAFGFSILTLMFEIALVALLLHPQSREYQRTWFK